MVGYEIDFSHLLIVEIHERVFRKTTTLLFSYFIFCPYRESIVPMIDVVDPLIDVTRTVYVGMIRDESNP